MLLGGVSAGPQGTGMAIEGREGRQGCRLLFFLGAVMVSLGAPGSGYGERAGGDLHPLVRDVRVLYPDRAPASEDGLSDLPSRRHILPGKGENPAGRGLLKFYGCVTCHDLPVKPFTARWGPDLDRIGEKTTEAWLRGWLEDPSAVLRDARMPRVPLREAEREALVAFLKMQEGKGELPVVARGNAFRGKAIYATAQCGVCHRLGGEGGDRAPDLDGAGEKIRRAWLVAYLMDPSSMVPNTTMPFYGFSREQAGDLAAFLLRGDGVGSQRAPPEAPAPSKVQAGLSAFVQRGCAQCHRIGAYYRPLETPSGGMAVDFVDHHATDRQGSPRVRLREAQTEVMARALVSLDREVETDGVEAFLGAFWETPIPLQGWAPAAYDSAAADLHPGACGGCHTAQLADWKTTLHSRSMGPGVMGQLLDGMWQGAELTEGCQSCHAPMSEQHPVLPDESGGYDYNHQYDPSLQGVGITCTVCHVRGHVRYGPPRGSRPVAQVWGGPGHGGAVVAPVFESSEFCRGCHQFGPDETRLNGKLLQDTYAEWLASPQRTEGETCQSCHMPDRRHLWKGIHDAETVREALKLEAVPLEENGDSLTVEVRLSNTGAGHHLPTYVTPKLFVMARLLDGTSQPLAGTEAVRAIGREIVLTTEERREVFDTRIPAGGLWVWRYAQAQRAAAVALEVSVEVHPDHFYLGFFEAYSREGLSPRATAMIDSAEANARRSPYPLMAQQWPLTDLAGE